MEGLKYLLYSIRAKLYGKTILPYDTINRIFNDNPRSEWIKIMDEKLVYKEVEPNPNSEYKYIHILNSDPNDMELYISKEEISMKTFPIDIGDIVTHKEKGGRFVIYDLPLIDNRRLIKINNIASKMQWGCQFYYVDGFLDEKTIAGYNLTGSVFNESYKIIDLSEDDCYWRNWNLVGSIFDMPKDPLARIFLDYWGECPVNYQPLHDKIFSTWSKEEIKEILAMNERKD